MAGHFVNYYLPYSENGASIPPEDCASLPPHTRRHQAGDKRTGRSLQTGWIALHPSPLPPCTPGLDRMGLSVENAGAMDRSTGWIQLAVGALAALFLLWLTTWIVFGGKIYGPERHNWDQTLIAAVTGLAAFQTARQARTPYRGFLALQGVALCSWRGHG